MDRSDGRRGDVANLSEKQDALRLLIVRDIHEAMIGGLTYSEAVDAAIMAVSDYADIRATHWRAAPPPPKDTTHG